MSEALWGTWGKNGTGLTTFMLKQWLKNYSIKPYAVRAGGARATSGEDAPCPWPKHTAGPESWPKAQAMRRKLIEELDAA